MGILVRGTHTGKHMREKLELATGDEPTTKRLKVCVYMYNCRVENPWSIILQGIPDVSVLSAEEQYRFMAIAEVYI